MEYSVTVRFDAATREEANSIATDIEQVLSGRPIRNFLEGCAVPDNQVADDVTFPHSLRVDRYREVELGAEW